MCSLREFESAHSRLCVGVLARELRVRIERARKSAKFGRVEVSLSVILVVVGHLQEKLIEGVD